jgi:hypothetical protein
MSHSYNKIWIHAIWATKERVCLLEPAIESRIHNYMRVQFQEMGCPTMFIVCSY